MTSEDRIKEESAIPMEIRGMLNMYPRAELRPPQLVKWVGELITASRRHGINDLKTVGWIRKLCKDHYSNQQINAIIYDIKAGYFDNS
jgi:hypothetical protein